MFLHTNAAFEVQNRVQFAWAKFLLQDDIRSNVQISHVMLMFMFLFLHPPL